MYIVLLSQETPEISAYVDYPDGSFSRLTFSDGFASLKPTISGTYVANAVLSKNGVFGQVISREFSFTVNGSGMNSCANDVNGFCDISCQMNDPDCVWFNGNVMLIVIIVASIAVIVAIFMLRGRNVQKS